MKYFVYHIPGKKIGVTNNLDRRLTQQGYSPSEYEILFEGTDIDEVSKLELQLQKQHGYRVDDIEYKDLFKSKNMKFNITEQTTTFPCSKKDLKNLLLDNIGVELNLPTFGDVVITDELIDWVMSNVITSYYNKNRCFVYNKAMYVFSLSLLDTDKTLEDTSRYTANDFDPFGNRWESHHDSADSRVREYPTGMTHVVSFTDRQKSIIENALTVYQAVIDVSVESKSSDFFEVLSLSGLFKDKDICIKAELDEVVLESFEQNHGVTFPQFDS